jgi:hypothetical protein
MSRICPHCQASLPWKITLLKSRSIACPRCGNLSNRRSTALSMAMQFLLTWSTIVTLSGIRAEPYSYIAPVVAGLGVALIAFYQPLVPEGIRPFPSKRQLFILFAVFIALALSTPYAVSFMEQYTRAPATTCLHQQMSIWPSSCRTERQALTGVNLLYRAFAPQPNLSLQLTPTASLLVPYASLRRR